MKFSIKDLFSKCDQIRSWKELRNERKWKEMKGNAVLIFKETNYLWRTGKVRPRILRWDSKVGPWGGTLKWDYGVGAKGGTPVWNPKVGP